MHHHGYIHTEPHPEVEQPYPPSTPEAFDINHNGDYSGDAHLTIEGWRVTTVYEADSEFARHGQPIMRVKLPIDVLVNFIGDMIRDKVIEDLEQSTARQILGLVREKY